MPGVRAGEEEPFVPSAATTSRSYSPSAPSRKTPTLEASQSDDVALSKVVPIDVSQAGKIKIDLDGSWAHWIARISPNPTTFVPPLVEQQGHCLCVIPAEGIFLQMGCVEANRTD